MADNDAEFRSALTAFLQVRRKAEEGFCVSDEEFEQYLDFAVHSKRGIAEGFRVFYEMQGRYPTFEEMFPPNAPRLIPRR